MTNSMQGLTAIPEISWVTGIDVINGKATNISLFTFIENKEDPISNESFYTFTKEELTEFEKYINNGVDYFRVGSKKLPIFLELHTTPPNAYKINVNGFFKVSVDRIDFLNLVGKALEDVSKELDLE